MLKETHSTRETTIPNRKGVALVVEAARGRARKLVNTENNPIALRGHNSLAPWLETGDEVTIDETPEGAIITGRLMRDGEHPPATFQVHPDMQELASDRPLRLRSGESSITLLPNGEIILEGKTITQSAADNLRLRAPVGEEQARRPHRPSEGPALEGVADHSFLRIVRGALLRRGLWVSWGARSRGSVRPG